MSLTKKTAKTGQNNREVVIQAANLGVSFNTGYRKDDYKSHVINMFKKDREEKDKRTVWPLRHMDFTGYQGEILGIIGSNGAGKTTLCKMISGILHPDEGTISVDGKVSALFSLGMGFNKELTGRENVYLNGMMLGIEKSKIDDFFQDIYEFSELGTFMDRPMKMYSSGMKARLGFSVAAFLEPEVLILDEALNTGDMAFGKKAAKKMKELVSKAKMVILVTHSLKYAVKYCDRLMWLDKGVIREVGDPEEVADNYKASVPQRKRRKKRELQISKTDTNVRQKTVVKASDLSVGYKYKKETYWALKNVNFDIKEGEVVGIIGHNGAGKSTLCRLMTRILFPDRGSLELNGDTTALLGYGTGFNEQLTGKDNIYLNGMLLGIDKEKIDRDYPEIVRFSELKSAIDKPVKSYSSGMQSRLGFSIAATIKPDIFIIDEALSTGDMAFKQKASERIQEMMEEAKAVIIVSHSMSFVEKLCTRAIWMEKGQVRFDGDPEEAVGLYKAEVKKARNEKKKKRRKPTGGKRREKQARKNKDQKSDPSVSVQEHERKSADRK
ncbi:ABC transporter ATP-binding protein [Alteribacter natronophilus]|uniref:ABC transporter ATP-binding protein n=1 Tax=Alteribacter natronophilus TaxID=2583810 RepID=UPI00110D9C8B|nr:ABC transporter ATP-binding protein [Alteribacter natronophilus]TMW72348.1 ABC transporter ATP-binding protein [Alteribacter natronophilus]